MHSTNPALTSKVSGVLNTHEEGRVTAAFSGQDCKGGLKSPMGLSHNRDHLSHLMSPVPLLLGIRHRPDPYQVYYLK
ncbi:hypothetical protein OPQ81_003854 [Rhizoctonia solani]|nr:hypothetical protein OPQ81_003854 [Rhizoctonia solani]